MSSFNVIRIENPYKENDNVLELITDISGDRYILQHVIKIDGTYIFSIWHRSVENSKIIFNVLGETEEVSSTPTWQKYVKTIKSDGKEKNIYIQPALGITTYLYEGYLAEGIIDSSWLPAPEDIESEFTNVRSEIQQNADSILLRVENMYATKDNIDTVKSELILRSDSIQQNVATMMNEIELQKTTLSQTAQDLTFRIQEQQEKFSTEINNTNTDFQKYINTYETFIRLSEEGIDIGKLVEGINAPFSVNISNEQMSFKQNNVIVAYINHDKLYITDVHVKDSLTFGTEENGFFDWIPRESGNLSLVWREK